MIIIIIIINISYSVNQNYCYILIIPGFGIISTVVAANSNKSIFGQNGPWIGLTQYTQRTIFGEFKNWDINLLLQNTYNVSNIIYSFLVTNFVILNNPQITKALPRGAVGAAGSVTIIIFLTHLSARKARAHFFDLITSNKYIYLYVLYIIYVYIICKTRWRGQGVSRKNCWLKMYFSKHLRREHLTKEGLKKIAPSPVSIRTALSNGLSVQLKAAFPGIVPARRAFRVVSKITLCSPYTSGSPKYMGNSLINYRSTPSFCSLRSKTAPQPPFFFEKKLPGGEKNSYFKNFLILNFFKINFTAPRNNAGGRQIVQYQVKDQINNASRASPVLENIKQIMSVKKSRRKKIAAPPKSSLRLLSSPARFVRFLMSKETDKSVRPPSLCFTSYARFLAIYRSLYG